MFRTMYEEIKSNTNLKNKLVSSFTRNKLIEYSTEVYITRILKKSVPPLEPLLTLKVIQDRLW